MVYFFFFFFFQAEDGIRDLVRSRGLGDVYKRQKPDAHRHQLQDSDQIIPTGFQMIWLSHGL